MNETKNYEKIDRITPYTYPLGEVGGGIFKAYFSSYISLLMTNIYLFSVTVAGVLETITSITEWIGAAIFGVIFDHFHFKNAKYWPWFIIGGCGSAVCYIVIFAMPNFSSDPSKLVAPAAIFIFLAAVFVMSVNHLGATVYTQITRTPEERNRIAALSKLGRDGMKIVLGFITPLALVSFTEMYGGQEVKAWALLAYIYAGIALVIYLIVAILFKNGFVERNAVAELHKPKVERKKSSFMDTLKTLVTNRPLLSIFVSFCLIKTMFFIHINAASYTFRYYYGNFSYQSAFMTAFNVCGVVGALCGTFWRKVFKETKRCFIACSVVSLIGYAAAFFVMRVGGSVSMFIACIAWTSFFSGIQDPFVLGMFADGADYGCWKAGNRDYGVNMVAYSISVRVGLLVATWLRVGALNRGGFDAAALDAGAEVPAALYNSIHSLQTVIPAVIVIVALLIVVVGYNLTDEETARYRAEIAARDLSDSVSK